VCGSQFFYTPEIFADNLPALFPIGGRWRPFPPLQSEIPIFYYPEFSHVTPQPLAANNEQNNLAFRPPLLMPSEWAFVYYGPNRWDLADEWQHQQPNVYLGAFWKQYPWQSLHSQQHDSPLNFNCSLQFQSYVTDGSKFVSFALCARAALTNII